MSNLEFRTLLKDGWPELSPDVQERVVEFRAWLLEENVRQNLTRLTSPKDFFEGHVLDARAVLESSLVDFPAMDLGSGCGVPGLLCAIVRPDEWVLCDAEGWKADFLSRSVERFGLKEKVSVFSGRAEKYLEENSARTIVARAVGPVERIYSWLRPCSTWNNLVLLKARSWEEEWNTFLCGRFRRDLKLTASYEYLVGEEKRRRIIVKLSRVPRGTSV